MSTLSDSELRVAVAPCFGQLALEKCGDGHFVECCQCHRLFNGGDAVTTDKGPICENCLTQENP